ncbi:MAG TPA: hypothetical protein C5S51_10975 [Methanosarcinaceae archaeon]|nr:hypothetical protein [Methanosarcinaceae archaeon]
MSTIKCLIMKIGHMAQFQFSKFQDDRSVFTQCRQRTDLGIPTGKLCVHAAYMLRTCCVHVGADAKKKVTAIDLN